MISRIRGAISQWNDTSILVDVQGLSYEVFVPPTILKTLDRHVETDGTITLVTMHYYQVDVSRGIPMLIGFTNEVEREFFERFITVSGVGPKAALKALALPISVIANAIDAGDLSVLKSLPGIGAQRAKEIIAKLQGKVGKFGLIQDHGSRAASPAKPPPSLGGVAEEAVAVLLQLQYSKPEAKEMARKALERSPQLKTTEELLNEIYRMRLQQPVASER